MDWVGSRKAFLNNIESTPGATLDKTNDKPKEIIIILYTTNPL